MPPPFTPRLEILPPSQRALWDELVDVPPEFTLYGGTAIALHLGHRVSVDFDLFANQGFDPARLYRSIAFLRDAEILQQAPDTLTCLIDRGAPVQVSFFGLPEIGCVEAPHICLDNGLKLASLTDLAGMKAAVVQNRSQAKDYIDIAALIAHGVDLPTGLAASVIYGLSFNPQITLKALCYFGDGDLGSLPGKVRKQLSAAVVAVDLDRLPSLAAIRSHVTGKGTAG
jgi:hypothetical protein